jgi:hypothetical protein
MDNSSGYDFMNVTQKCSNQPTDGIHIYVDAQRQESRSYDMPPYTNETDGDVHNNLFS